MAFPYFTSLAGQPGVIAGSSYVPGVPCDTTQVLLVGLPPLILQCGLCDYLDVEVSHAEPDLSSIYIQSKRETNTILTLLRNLAQYCSSNPDVLYNPPRGTVCAAKFEDGQWYRAVVLDRPQPSQIRVFFIDYGNQGIVLKNDVRTLTDDFRAIPPQAIQVQLRGIKPDRALYPKLGSLLEGGEVVVQMDGNCGDRFLVTLYITKGRETVEANAILSGKTETTPPAEPNPPHNYNRQSTEYQRNGLNDNSGGFRTRDGFSNGGGYDNSRGGRGRSDYRGGGGRGGGFGGGEDRPNSRHSSEDGSQFARNDRGGYRGGRGGGDRGGRNFGGGDRGGRSFGHDGDRGGRSFGSDRGGGGGRSFGSERGGGGFGGGGFGNRAEGNRSQAENRSTSRQTSHESQQGSIQTEKRKRTPPPSIEWPSDGGNKPEKKVDIRPFGRQQVRPGLKGKAFLQHYVSPSSFYLHLEDWDGCLRTVEAEIAKAVKSGLTPLNLPQKNASCLAERSEEVDGEIVTCIYRARVTDISADSKLSVQFVDYGDSAEGLEKVHVVPEILLDIPCLCVHVSLNGVEGTEEGGKWSSDASKKAEHNLYERGEAPLEVEFVGKEGETYNVEILPDEEGGRTLNEDLLGEGLARKKRNFRYEPLHATLNTPTRGVVYYVESSQDFCVGLDKFNNDFVKIAEELTKYFEKPKREILKNPEVGDACISQYEGEWYRGEVEGISADGVTVRFVDFGNAELKSAEDIFPVEAEILKCRKTALRCHLEVGREDLEELMDQKTVSITVSKEENGICTVECFLVNDDGSLMNVVETKQEEEKEAEGKNVEQEDIQKEEEKTELQEGKVGEENDNVEQ